MRLIPVFFSMRPTCTYEMEGRTSNSMARSDMSLSVHFPLPLGGVLHAIATIFASTSPVHLAGTGGVSRFFRLIPFDGSESATLSRKCCFMLWTAWGVIPNMPAITLSFCRCLSPASSARRSTFARRISIAPPTPLRTVFSRVARCSLVSSIFSFLYFAISQI